jgi:hypothetical protein
MISKMRTDEIGSRTGIVMNGSPLFTGGAGSGESEIRRWMLENDWIEAIVALPTDLFYNTGIQTYVWLLTNRKERKRRGKVQLIDASGEHFWAPMRKSLGKLQPRDAFRAGLEIQPERALHPDLAITEIAGVENLRHRAPRPAAIRHLMEDMRDGLAPVVADFPALGA